MQPVSKPPLRSVQIGRQPSWVENGRDATPFTWRIGSDHFAKERRDDWLYWFQQ